MSPETEIAVACPACRTLLVLSIAQPRAESGAWPAPISPLTKREAEVLPLFAAGLRIRQIADRMHVSIHSARAYVKALMAKFSVHSQAELLERLHPPRA